ncbi:MAG: relaxase MobL [Sulfobacillus sp.]
MGPLIVKAPFFPPGPGRHQQARDYLAYIANPSRQDVARWQETLRQRDVENEAAVYALHLHERKGSQGLFGPVVDGSVSEAAIGRLFAKHQGPIWSLIVVMPRDDARQMGDGLMGRAAWEDACRAVLPKVAEAMGIPPEDLRWTAAMHRRPKDEYPHVHIILWSDQPTPRQRLTKAGLVSVRREWVHELYGPELARLGQQKGQARDDALRLGRLTLGRTEAHELGQRLTAIAASIPAQGRPSYAYLPPAAKSEVDQVVDWLIRRPEMARVAARFRGSAAEIATLYSTDPDKLDQAGLNALADLRQRLANSVIQTALMQDDQLAWRAITSDVWASLRATGDYDQALAQAMRRAVAATCASSRSGQALTAARELLRSPDLAAHLEAFRAAAARRGPPQTAELRVKKAVARLMVSVAGRLVRNADYVRTTRSYWAAGTFGLLFIAMADAGRAAQREAERAAARYTEEEERRLQAEAQYGYER